APVEPPIDEQYGRQEDGVVQRVERHGRGLPAASSALSGFLLIFLRPDRHSPFVPACPVIHRNVVAVVEAARKAGLEIEPREFPEGTRTAEDAARAIGVSVAQI